MSLSLRHRPLFFSPCAISAHSLAALGWWARRPMSTAQRLFQRARRLLPHGRRSLMAAAAASTAVIGPMAAWQLSDSTPSSDSGSRLLSEEQLREGLLRRWPTAACEPTSPEDKRGFAELVRDYEVSGKQLGDGAYSVVMRGRSRKTGEPVAIKIVPKVLDENAADYKRLQADEEVRREVEMLKRVSVHSCISRFEVRARARARARSLTLTLNRALTLRRTRTRTRAFIGPEPEP